MAPNGLLLPRKWPQRHRRWVAGNVGGAMEGKQVVEESLGRE